MEIKRKNFVSEIKQADDGDLVISHFVSTEEIDRGGDCMRADGMRIEGRPVVLLQHGRTGIGAEPIGKPLDIRADVYQGKKGIIARTKFYDDALGRRIYEKVRDGYMPSFSVGYIIDESKDVLKNGKFHYRDILRWRLLEYSVVGIPMNAGATTFKDGGEEEALCFKILPDDSEECCGDCKGDVKCAGHREKETPPADPPAPEGEKETTPEHPFQIVEDPPTDPPPAPEGPTLKDLCDSIQIVADNVSRMSLDFIKATGRIDELSKALEPLLKTLPPEPDGGEKGDEEHHENPPEEKKTPPRLVIVREEETPEGKQKAQRAMLLAVAREAIGAEVAKEIDRLKGRVH